MAVKGDPSSSNRNFGYPWPDFGVEPISVYAQVARGVAVTDQAGLHGAPPFVDVKCSEASLLLTNMMSFSVVRSLSHDGRIHGQDTGVERGPVGVQDDRHLRRRYSYGRSARLHAGERFQGLQRYEALRGVRKKIYPELYSAFPVCRTSCTWWCRREHAPQGCVSAPTQSCWASLVVR